MYVASAGRWDVVLDAGQAFRLVRSTEPRTDFDLPFGGDLRLHRLTGVVEVFEDRAVLVNRGRWVNLQVHDVDGRGRVTVRPGEEFLTHWRAFRIEADFGDVVEGVQIERVEESRIVIEREPATDGTQTLHPIALSHHAGYFKALLGLCEPRLIDPRSDRLPSDSQIAARINRSGVEPNRITGKTVEKRLEYCRKRLRLRPFDEAGAGAEDRDARRRLAEFAVRNQVVRRDHLSVFE